MSDQTNRRITRGMLTGQDAAGGDQQANEPEIEIINISSDSVEEVESYPDEYYFDTSAEAWEAHLQNLPEDIQERYHNDEISFEEVDEMVIERIRDERDLRLAFYREDLRARKAMKEAEKKKKKARSCGRKSTGGFRRGRGAGGSGGHSRFGGAGGFGGNAIGV
jgi:hypothetical protein